MFSSSVISDSFVTVWTVAHQAPLSMGLSWQEYCSGLPFPSSGDLFKPGIKPVSSEAQGCIGRQILYHISHLGSPISYCHTRNILPVYLHFKV